MADETVERGRRAIAEHRPINVTPAREGGRGVEPTGQTRVACACGAGPFDPDPDDLGGAGAVDFLRHQAEAALAALADAET